MPTYEYRCPDGHDFERFYRKISDASSDVMCPVCGKPAARIMSAGAGLLFKGSGFYLTDYGKNAHRRGGDINSGGDKSGGDKSGGDGTSTASPGGKSSDSGGGESKATESKSSESKPAESKPAESKNSGSTGAASTSSSSTGPKSDK
jgi:putative FmdB family regulatory protein